MSLLPHFTQFGFEFFPPLIYEAIGLLYSPLCRRPSLYLISEKAFI